LARRKELGFSRRRLEKETGIPLSTIYAWEKGKRKPSAEALARLAQALNCSLEHFFDQFSYKSSENGDPGIPKFGNKVFPIKPNADIPLPLCRT